MNKCAIAEVLIAKRESITLDPVSFLIGFIDPSQYTDKLFPLTDHELVNRALFPGQDAEQSFNESNSIFLFLFFLLLFIAFALTDIGVLLGFNVTNR